MFNNDINIKKNRTNIKSIPMIKGYTAIRKIYTLKQSVQNICLEY